MKRSVPISVVMPCHNSSAFIGQAIDSIINQTFEDFEFIIIDDGSSDDTISIINRHSDPRIKVITSEHQMGNFFCRNIGIAGSSGKYICVMDSDDVSLPNRLKVQYDFLERNRQVGVVGSNAERIDAYGNSLGVIEKFSFNSQLKVSLLRDSVCVHPSIFFRRKIVDKHGIVYNHTMKYAADYSFLVDCSRYFELRNLPQVLLQYRVHHGQISNVKRAEQAAYANQIRNSQLSNFGIKLSDSETTKYLHLMTGSSIDPAEKNNYVDILNKLLAGNRNTRYYNQGKLYLLFYAIMANCCDAHPAQ